MPSIRWLSWQGRKTGFMFAFPDGSSVYFRWRRAFAWSHDAVLDRHGRLRAPYGLTLRLMPDAAPRLGWVLGRVYPVGQRVRRALRPVVRVTRAFKPLGPFGFYLEVER